MELKDRFNLLSQAAQLAQQNGVLTLDDAVIVKNAVDFINKGENVKESVNVLIKLAQVAQKKGAFTLKDAFYIYMAIDGIDEELKNIDDANEQNKKGEE